MNVLDLFSGIGGFSLGLERAGMRTVAFCEIDPYCRSVLTEHWPDVPLYGDIRELTAGRLRADGIIADVICGGFPCQDISSAGKKIGIDGERSGLWQEFARLICDIQPRYAIVENVSALLNRGLDRVLGDLAAIGYNAEWHCIPATAVGAPHRRDRIWIIAYPVSDGIRQQPIAEFGSRIAALLVTDGSESSMADANREGLEIIVNGKAGQCAPSIGAHAWSSEPDVGRVAYGVSNRVDRLRTLGNSVVPQIPEIIGRAIMMAVRPEDGK